MYSPFPAAAVDVLRDSATHIMRTNTSKRYSIVFNCVVPDRLHAIRSTGVGMLEENTAHWVYQVIDGCGFLEVKTHGLTSQPLTRSPVRDPKVRPTRRDDMRLEAGRVQ